MYSQLWVARRVYSRLGYATFFLWRGALFAPADFPRVCIEYIRSDQMYGHTRSRMLPPVDGMCLLMRAVSYARSHAACNQRDLYAYARRSHGGARKHTCGPRDPK